MTGEIVSAPQKKSLSLERTFLATSESETVSNFLLKRNVLYFGRFLKIIKHPEMNAPKGGKIDGKTG